MLSVKKRDGLIVPFELEKIEKAIKKAFEAKSTSYTTDIIEKLALRVTAQMNHLVTNEVINIEDVQDSVEIVLIEASYTEVAKAYILYRKKRENIRHAGETILD